MKISLNLLYRHFLTWDNGWMPIRYLLLLEVGWTLNWIAFMIWGAALANVPEAFFALFRTTFHYSASINLLNAYLNYNNKPHKRKYMTLVWLIGALISDVYCLLDAWVYLPAVESYSTAIRVLSIITVGMTSFEIVFYCIALFSTTRAEKKIKQNKMVTEPLLLETRRK